MNVIPLNSESICTNTYMTFPLEYLLDTSDLRYPKRHFNFHSLRSSFSGLTSWGNDSSTHSCWGQKRASQLERNVTYHLGPIQQHVLLHPKGNNTQPFTRLHFCYHHPSSSHHHFLTALLILLLAPVCSPHSICGDLLQISIIRHFSSWHPPWNSYLFCSGTLA